MSNLSLALGPCVLSWFGLIFLISSLSGVFDLSAPRSFPYSPSRPQRVSSSPDPSPPGFESSNPPEFSHPEDTGAAPRGRGVVSYSGLRFGPQLPSLSLGILGGAIWCTVKPLAIPPTSATPPTPRCVSRSLCVIDSVASPLLLGLRRFNVCWSHPANALFLFPRLVPPSPPPTSLQSSGPGCL